jgi:hypothetical protein
MTENEIQDLIIPIEQKYEALKEQIKDKNCSGQYLSDRLTAIHTFQYCLCILENAKMKIAIKNTSEKLTEIKNENKNSQPTETKPATTAMQPIRRYELIGCNNKSICIVEGSFWIADSVRDHLKQNLGEFITLIEVPIEM